MPVSSAREVRGEVRQHFRKPSSLGITGRHLSVSFLVFYRLSSAILWSADFGAEQNTLRRFVSYVFYFLFYREQKHMVSRHHED